MLYYFDDEQYMSIDLNAPSEDAEETTKIEEETSENENTEKDAEEKISFEIVNGQSGEYAKSRTVNKETSM